MRKFNRPEGTDATGRAFKPGDYFIFATRYGSSLFMKFGRCTETRSEMGERYGRTFERHTIGAIVYGNSTDRVSTIERVDNCVIVSADRIPDEVRTAIGPAYNAAVKAQRAVRAEGIAAARAAHEERVAEAAAEPPALAEDIDDVDDLDNEIGGEA